MVGAKLCVLRTAASSLAAIMAAAASVLPESEFRGDCQWNGRRTSVTLLAGSEYYDRCRRGSGREQDEHSRRRTPCVERLRPQTTSRVRQLDLVRSHCDMRHTCSKVLTEDCSDCTVTFPWPGLSSLR